MFCFTLFALDISQVLQHLPEGYKEMIRLIR